MNPAKNGIHSAGMQYPFSMEQKKESSAAAQNFLNLLAPEEHWGKIQSSRVKVSPDPKLEVVVQRTNATFLESLFTTNPKKEYSSLIKKAENTLKKNIATANEGEAREDM